MEYLCFLTLVLWGCVGGGTAEENDDSYPKYVLKANVTEVDSKYNFVFTWDPVKSWDGKDPVIGYSIVIWEMKMLQIKSVEYYNWVNRQRVERCVDVESVSTSAYPPEPTIITVSADKHKATYENAKRGAWYFHAAFAFTKNGQGPTSPVSCFKVNGEIV